jgi:D-alanine-D-alanine ligase
MTSHNKFYSYSIAKELGINVPETHFCTKANAYDVHVTRFPVIVKPNDQGGSEGIEFRNVVYDQVQLATLVQDVTGKYGEAIIQEFLPGNEVTIGVFRHGDDLVPTEPRMSQFRNFGNDPAILAGCMKWHLDEGNREIIKTTFDGDPATKEQLIGDTMRFFKTFDCKDFARADWKQDTNGTYRFIDLNENPGYYSTSLFRWCLEKKGLCFKDLVFAIIDNILASIETTNGPKLETSPEMLKKGLTINPVPLSRQKT